jgi:hypothetical protein
MNIGDKIWVAGQVFTIIALEPMSKGNQWWYLKAAGHKMEFYLEFTEGTPLKFDKA